MTVVYLTGAALRYHRWRGVALGVAGDWQHATSLVATARIAQAALIIAPVAVPAGLAAGGAAWAWRIWAINAGLAGRSAFAPAAFDARQWRRQVAAARGALAAPGLVPLATAAGTVPVGPVIRAIGRRWSPVLAVPAASFARHMVDRRRGGQRQDEPDDAAVGWLVRRHAAPPPGGAGRGRCWPHWTARAARTPGPKPTAPAACCTASAPAGSRSGPMKPPCRCGTCRPATWRCCCTS